MFGFYKKQEARSEPVPAARTSAKRGGITECSPTCVLSGFKQKIPNTNNNTTAFDQRTFWDSTRVESPEAEEKWEM